MRIGTASVLRMWVILILGGILLPLSTRTASFNLYALLCKKFNLHPDSYSLVYHHWYDLTTGERTDGTGNTKSCPGTNFFGGNTVEAAEQNFILLITQQLAAYSGPAPVTQVEPLYVADVQIDELNVRAQPSSVAAIVKQLNRGAES